MTAGASPRTAGETRLAVQDSRPTVGIGGDNG